MHPRASRPRRMGLLTTTTEEIGQHLGPWYPYALGDRIGGDLTVIGHLARGRIGHLYQVWSASGWCAFTCKILSPHLRDDRTAIATLRRETRILHRLRHPNLIRGFGGGEHAGLPYLLMEYVAGPSLFDLLQGRSGRRLGLADAIRTAIHIGAGIQHLHRCGYLYLDLKPANLMLRNQVPVLVDFDTACRIRLGKGRGNRLGTAPYMAPEQVRGETLTPAADLYGLGAVLYEMVTGRWPFEAVFAGDEVREGEERRYPQLGSTSPTPPVLWNPAIPDSLSHLISRALAPAPSDRIPSIHAFLLALSAQLDETTALWPGGIQAERRQSFRAQPELAASNGTAQPLYEPKPTSEQPSP